MAAGVSIGFTSGKGQGEPPATADVQSQAALAHDGSTNVVDANLLSRLPYYLTSLACSHFPQWTIWNKLYGTIDWKANSGNVMRGVRHEPTPIKEALVSPKAAYDPWPDKNIYNMGEMSEEAVVCLHDFESKLFYFQPVWADFAPTLEATYSDINRQIGVYSDNYARTNAFGRVRQGYAVGAGLFTDATGETDPGTNGSIYADTTTIPRLMFNPPDDDGTAAVTGTHTNIPLALTATLDAIIAKIDAGGVLGLTLGALDDAVAVFRDDIMIPFFEGAVNVPKNNEVIAGKYVLVCSSEVYQMLKWDPHYSTFRDWNFDAMTNGFRGSIFNELTAHIEHLPLRIKKAGVSGSANTFIPTPQIYQDEPGGVPGVSDNGDNSTKTALTHPTSRLTTRVNPAYRDAEYEVAWLLGADFFKTIRVGPPPSAFSGKMSKKKFYSMSWNGEVELTDQILIERDTGQYELNAYGRYCKYIASLACGAIPCNPYAGMPLFFKRRRPPTAAVTVGAAQQVVGADPASTPIS